MPGSRYPAYDVTVHADAWDDHTRSIVLRRLDPPGEPALLSAEETTILDAVVRRLLNEERDDIVAYIVSHFDQKLSAKSGESDRKATVPPAPDLVRSGLAALDAAARARSGRSFTDCSADDQFRILSDLQKGQVSGVPEMDALPQKDLFKKLLSIAVEAFASHPAVWSEMGYAGPAYPRGYYRIERGLTDPWEPKAEKGGSVDVR